MLKVKEQYLLPLIVLTYFYALYHDFSNCFLWNPRKKLGELDGGSVTVRAKKMFKHNSFSITGTLFNQVFFKLTGSAA